MNFDTSGAKTFSRILTRLSPIGDTVISETAVVLWLVTLITTGLCIFLTRDLKVEHTGKRQALTELTVESAGNLVRNNMGGNRSDYLIPFVGTLLSTSVISNLISLVGLRNPIADLSVEAVWAVTAFTMITLNRIEMGGLLGYLKGFTTPIPVMTPFNIPPEIATPISIACRHFGNVFSGTVINRLICAALDVASAIFFGLTPGAVGDSLSHIPILVVEFPAITSLYFDWSSGIMQVFIFTMLTIMYIVNTSEG